MRHLVSNPIALYLLNGIRSNGTRRLLRKGPKSAAEKYPKLGD